MISEPESPQEERYACPPKTLQKHMQYLRDNDYNIVNLDTITDYLNNKVELPKNTIAITLDDGFSDNYENAFPIFQKFKIPATIFLASGMMEKTNTWMQTSGFSKRNMLSWSQISEMQKSGISFGAHTVNHVKLPELSADEMLTELVNSKQQIEDKLNITIKHFAYPYGLLDDTVRTMTEKADYTTACSTRSGFNNLDTDPLILRRLEVYGTDSVRALKQKITFGVNDSEISFPIHYYLNRIKDRLR
ncbi:MAG: polysaccharide deacetylase family protein [Methyloprofundus sp.]|nr:polysaccharide deacetylase family protein [Methyloprofundus sp.]